MARIADHPLRLARLQLGLSQVALATRAGVNRAAITAIEDGRTKNPSQKILDVIASGLGINEAELAQNIQDYVTKPVVITPPPAVQNLMVIPPYTLSQYYKTFKQWRLEIAKNAYGVGKHAPGKPGCDLKVRVWPAICVSGHSLP